MKKSKFNLACKDPALLELMQKATHQDLARWAIECTERVMPFFEKQFPDDPRPRHAIDTLQTWINTGEFKMSVIRHASLSSHAAAREVGEDSPARSAARSAGQCVATAHVRTHALGAAIYALQAIYRSSIPEEAESALAKEREWQYHRLKELISV